MGEQRVKGVEIREQWRLAGHVEAVAGEATEQSAVGGDVTTFQGFLGRDQLRFGDFAFDQRLYQALGDAKEACRGANTSVRSGNPFSDVFPIRLWQDRNLKITDRFVVEGLARSADGQTVYLLLQER